MPRPSDRAAKRQAELAQQSQSTPIRLDNITIGVTPQGAVKPGGRGNNLKTIDLRRTGRGR